MNKNILVIGGAGYIGSHMVRALLDEKHNPIVFDNLSTGHKGFIPEEAIFIQADLRNIQDVSKALERYSVDAVMHFAASSIVPESMSNPLKYYEGCKGGEGCVWEKKINLPPKFRNGTQIIQISIDK
jgi:UDP-glucose 4-epimerase